MSDIKIPSDPAMLLSFINLKLRDFYPTLDALCEDIGCDKNEICDKLALIDYEYDEQENRFV